MKKHTYRAQKVNNINWQQVKEQTIGETLVLAVDVAKVQQYALLTNQEHTQSWLMQWSHLEHTPYLIEQLKALEVAIIVVMESTSTYGDSLRYQCRQAGFAIYQANAKKVHDAREIYDGVPSLHDAKAAWLIAKLHKDGATKLWCEPTMEERRMNAFRLEYELHQDQHLRNQNRLEAYLSRHWPEVLTIMPLDSVTLEQLIKTYGCPQEVAAQSEQAALNMRCWGKSGLSSVGYGLQIYFDFSGYSDMAIGIGLMFGIILPQNFNSPYQAVSIADFWKRWHMTLSRFLRDYVYIPLGGNRNGFVRGLLGGHHDDYRRLLARRCLDLCALGYFAWGLYRHSPSLDESPYPNTRAGSYHSYFHVSHSSMGRIPCRIRRPSHFYLERDDRAEWFCYSQHRIRILSKMHPNHFNLRDGVRTGRYFAGDLHGVYQRPESSPAA